jgi:hypothetical protein
MIVEHRLEAIGPTAVAFSGLLVNYKSMFGHINMCWDFGILGGHWRTTDGPDFPRLSQTCFGTQRRFGLFIVFVALPSMCSHIQWFWVFPNIRLISSDSENQSSMRGDHQDHPDEYLSEA